MPKLTPPVRRQAELMGLSEEDLTRIRGTAKSGYLTVSDLEAYLAAQTPRFDVVPRPVSGGFGIWDDTHRRFVPGTPTFVHEDQATSFLERVQQRAQTAQARGRRHLTQTEEEGNQRLRDLGMVATPDDLPILPPSTPLPRIPPTPQPAPPLYTPDEVLPMLEPALVPQNIEDAWNQTVGYVLGDKGQRLGFDPYQRAFGELETLYGSYEDEQRRLLAQQAALEEELYYSPLPSPGRTPSGYSQDNPPPGWNEARFQWTAAHLPDLATQAAQEEQYRPLSLPPVSAGDDFAPVMQSARQWLLDEVHAAPHPMLGWTEQQWGDTETFDPERHNRRLHQAVQIIHEPRALDVRVPDAPNGVPPADPAYVAGGAKANLSVDALHARLAELQQELGTFEISPLEDNHSALSYFDFDLAGDVVRRDERGFTLSQNLRGKPYQYAVSVDEQTGMVRLHSASNSGGFYAVTGDLTEWSAEDPEHNIVSPFQVLERGLRRGAGEKPVSLGSYVAEEHGAPYLSRTALSPQNRAYWGEGAYALPEQYPQDHFELVRQMQAAGLGVISRKGRHANPTAAMMAAAFASREQVVQDAEGLVPVTQFQLSKFKRTRQSGLGNEARLMEGVGVAVPYFTAPARFESPLAGVPGEFEAETGARVLEVRELESLFLPEGQILGREFLTGRISTVNVHTDDENAFAQGQFYADDLDMTGIAPGTTGAGTIQDFRSRLGGRTPLAGDYYAVASWEPVYEGGQYAGVGRLAYIAHGTQFSHKLRSKEAVAFASPEALRTHTMGGEIINPDFRGRLPGAGDLPAYARQTILANYPTTTELRQWWGGAGGWTDEAWDLYQRESTAAQPSEFGQQVSGAWGRLMARPEFAGVDWQDETQRRAVLQGLVTEQGVIKAPADELFTLGSVQDLLTRRTQVVTDQNRPATSGQMRAFMAARLAPKGIDASKMSMSDVVNSFFENQANVFTAGGQNYTHFERDDLVPLAGHTAAGSYDEATNFLVRNWRGRAAITHNLMHPRPESVRGTHSLKPETLEWMSFTNPGLFTALVNQSQAGLLPDSAQRTVRGFMANFSQPLRESMSLVDFDPREWLASIPTGAEEDSDLVYQMLQNYGDTVSGRLGTDDWTLRVRMTQGQEVFLPNPSALAGTVTQDTQGNLIHGPGVAVAEALGAISNLAAGDLWNVTPDTLLAADESIFRAYESLQDYLGHENVMQAALGLEVRTTGGIAHALPGLEPNEVLMSLHHAQRMTGFSRDELLAMTDYPALDAARARGENPNELALPVTRYPLSQAAYAFAGMKIGWYEQELASDNPLRRAMAQSVANPGRGFYMSELAMQTQLGDFDADYIFGFLNWSKDRQTGQAVGGNVPLADTATLEHRARILSGSEYTKMFEEAQDRAVAGDWPGLVDAVGQKMGGQWRTLSEVEDLATTEESAKSGVGLPYNTLVRQMAMSAELQARRIFGDVNHPVAQRVSEAMRAIGNYGYQKGLDLVTQTDPGVINLGNFMQYLDWDVSTHSDKVRDQRAFGKYISTPGREASFQSIMTSSRGHQEGLARFLFEQAAGIGMERNLPVRDAEGRPVVNPETGDPDTTTVGMSREEYAGFAPLMADALVPLDVMSEAQEGGTWEDLRSNVAQLLTGFQESGGRNFDYGRFLQLTHRPTMASWLTGFHQRPDSQSALALALTGAMGLRNQSKNRRGRVPQVGALPQAAEAVQAARQFFSDVTKGEAGIPGALEVLKSGLFGISDLIAERFGTGVDVTPEQFRRQIMPPSARLYEDDAGVRSLGEFGEPITLNPNTPYPVDRPPDEVVPSNYMPPSRWGEGKTGEERLLRRIITESGVPRRLVDPLTIDAMSALADAGDIPRTSVPSAKSDYVYKELAFAAGDTMEALFQKQLLGTSTAIGRDRNSAERAEFNRQVAESGRGKFEVINPARGARGEEDVRLRAGDRSLVVSNVKTTRPGSAQERLLLNRMQLPDEWAAQVGLAYESDVSGGAVQVGGQLHAVGAEGAEFAGITLLQMATEASGKPLTFQGQAAEYDRLRQRSYEQLAARFTAGTQHVPSFWPGVGGDRSPAAWQTYVEQEFGLAQTWVPEGLAEDQWRGQQSFLFGAMEQVSQAEGFGIPFFGISAQDITTTLNRLDPLRAEDGSSLLERFRDVMLHGYASGPTAERAAAWGIALDDQGKPKDAAAYTQWVLGVRSALRGTGPRPQAPKPLRKIKNAVSSLATPKAAPPPRPDLESLLPQAAMVEAVLHQGGYPQWYRDYQAAQAAGASDRAAGYIPGEVKAWAETMQQEWDARFGPPPGAAAQPEPPTPARPEPPPTLPEQDRLDAIGPPSTRAQTSPEPATPPARREPSESAPTPPLAPPAPPRREPSDPDGALADPNEVLWIKQFGDDQQLGLQRGTTGENGIIATPESLFGALGASGGNATFGKHIRPLTIEEMRGQVIDQWQVFQKFARAYETGGMGAGMAAMGGNTKVLRQSMNKLEDLLHRGTRYHDLAQHAYGREAIETPVNPQWQDDFEIGTPSMIDAVGGLDAAAWITGLSPDQLRDQLKNNHQLELGRNMLQRVQAMQDTPEFWDELRQYQRQHQVTSVKEASIHEVAKGRVALMQMAPEAIQHGASEPEIVAQSIDHLKTLTEEIRKLGEAGGESAKLTREQAGELRNMSRSVTDFVKSAESIQREAIDIRDELAAKTGREKTEVPMDEAVSHLAPEKQQIYRAAWGTDEQPDQGLLRQPEFKTAALELAEQEQALRRGQLGTQESRGERASRGAMGLYYGMMALRGSLGQSFGASFKEAVGMVPYEMAVTSEMGLGPGYAQIAHAKSENASVSMGLAAQEQFGWLQNLSSDFLGTRQGANAAQVLRGATGLLLSTNLVRDNVMRAYMMTNDEGQQVFSGPQWLASGLGMFAKTGLALGAAMVGLEGGFQLTNTLGLTQDANLGDFMSSLIGRDPVAEGVKARERQFVDAARRGGYSAQDAAQVQQMVTGVYGRGTGTGLTDTLMRTGMSLGIDPTRYAQTVVGISAGLSPLDADASYFIAQSLSQEGMTLSEADARTLAAAQLEQQALARTDTHRRERAAAWGAAAFAGTAGGLGVGLPVAMGASVAAAGLGYALTGTETVSEEDLERETARLLASGVEGKLGQDALSRIQQFSRTYGSEITALQRMVGRADYGTFRQFAQLAGADREWNFDLRSQVYASRAVDLATTYWGGTGQAVPMAQIQAVMPAVSGWTEQQPELAQQLGSLILPYQPSFQAQQSYLSNTFAGLNALGSTNVMSLAQFQTGQGYAPQVSGIGSYVETWQPWRVQQLGNVQAQVEYWTGIDARQFGDLTSTRTVTAVEKPSQDVVASRYEDELRHNGWQRAWSDDAFRQAQNRIGIDVISEQVTSSQEDALFAQGTQSDLDAYHSLTGVEKRQFLNQWWEANVGAAQGLTSSDYFNQVFFDDYFKGSPEYRREVERRWQAAPSETVQKQVETQTPGAFAGITRRFGPLTQPQSEVAAEMAGAFLQNIPAPPTSQLYSLYASGQITSPTPEAWQMAQAGLAMDLSLSAVQGLYGRDVSEIGLLATQAAQRGTIPAQNTLDQYRDWVKQYQPHEIDVLARAMQSGTLYGQDWETEVEQTLSTRGRAAAQGQVDILDLYGQYLGEPTAVQHAVAAFSGTQPLGTQRSIAGSIKFGAEVGVDLGLASALASRSGEAGVSALGNINQTLYGLGRTGQDLFFGSLRGAWFVNRYSVEAAQQAPELMNFGYSVGISRQDAEGYGYRYAAQFPTPYDEGWFKSGVNKVMDLGVSAPAASAFTSNLFAGQGQMARTWGMRFLGGDSLAYSLFANTGYGQSLGLQPTMDVNTGLSIWQQDQWALQAQEHNLQVQNQVFGLQQQQQQYGLSHAMTFGGSFQVGGQSYAIPYGKLDIDQALWNIGVEQQQYNFQYQERSLQRDYARQKTEMTVDWSHQQQQLDWQAADLDYSRDRSEIGFAWQMEDFDYNIRYARGRERRQLMKQRDRAVISQAMEMGHLDQQEDRLDQQRQWAEEAHKRQQSYFEDNFKLQAERLQKEREFFNERLVWQTRDRDLTRLQADLSDQLNRRQLEHSAQMLTQNEALWQQEFAMSQEIARRNGEVNVFYAVTLPQLIQTNGQALADAIKNAVSGVSAGGGTTGGTGGGYGTGGAAHPTGLLALSKTTPAWKPSGHEDKVGYWTTKSSAGDGIYTYEWWEYERGGLVGSPEDYGAVPDSLISRQAFIQGYTGDGARTTRAGLAHAGEWVVPQNGSLVIRGENTETVKTLVEIRDLLRDIRAKGLAQLIFNVKGSEVTRLTQDLLDKTYQ